MWWASWIIERLGREEHDQASSSFSNVRTSCSAQRVTCDWEEETVSWQLRAFLSSVLRNPANVHSRELSFAEFMEAILELRGEKSVQ